MLSDNVLLMQLTRRAGLPQLEVDNTEVDKVLYPGSVKMSGNALKLAFVFSISR